MSGAKELFFTVLFSASLCAPALSDEALSPEGLGLPVLEDPVAPAEALLAKNPPLESEGNDYDINFYIEDDFSGISLGDDDCAYTGGWRLSFVKAIEEFPVALKPLLGWLAEEGAKYNVGFALGQQLYTPVDLSQTALIPNDQPYAAYLFAGASFQIRNDDVLHSFEIDMGVVGPPALGEQLQINFHRIFGFDPVNGWKNQLATETTTTLFYQQKRVLFAQEGGAGNRIADLVGNFEGALGNLYVYAGLGAQLRVGWNIDDDFGPTVLTPVGVDRFVEKGAQGRGLGEIYLFSSIDARLMGRNLFLDGNTFQAGPHVARLGLVYDVDFGATLRIASFAVSWRQIIRSREFSLETGPHDFASLLFNYTRRF